MVEGRNDLQENYLQQMLNRNMGLIHKFHPKNADLLFLQGWMIDIAPWYFDIENNDFGDECLTLAYKFSPDHLLFKWALSDRINTSEGEVRDLESVIVNDLDKYYINYEPIQEYSKNIVGTRT